MSPISIKSFDFKVSIVPHLELLFADDRLAGHRLRPVEGLAEFPLDGAILTDQLAEENKLLFALLALQKLAS